MGNNPFFFPSTLSYSLPSFPSSSSSSSPSPSLSLSSNSPCPSSQSLNSPFQPSFPFPPSLTSSSHVAGPPSATVSGPCAACKILGQRCTDKCYIASYFPPTTEPHKFTVVGSLFGGDDIVDYLQQNSNSSSYVPLLLLLRDTSKDGTQLQANPSKTSNINGQRQPMLANSENSKAHSYSSSSKPLLMMFGTNDDKGTLTSPANHLGDNIDLELQAEMEDESLKFIVDQRDKVAHKDDSKDFTSAHPYITSSKPPEIFGSGYPNLRWVSTTGSGPKGRTISGITYRYTTQIKIVCACHGSHMSPEEFVRHASEENVNLENGNGSASASFPSTDPAYIEPWWPGFSSSSRGTQEDKLAVKTSGVQFIKGKHLSRPDSVKNLSRPKPRLRPVSVSTISALVPPVQKL